ncbi:homoserine kinase [Oleidesulfovibrio sp.]|uniref:homoserine kinase n=1 Tax=Oleidesulfovibrio sp. TaxID=2909707 RepID=UPI003A88A0A2
MAQRTYIPRPEKSEQDDCIILIGMAGSGKTTIGTALARRMDWAHMDTDHLIEAHYGTNLQNVADSMDKESFLNVESSVCQRVTASRTVISTGGSVIYRKEAMQHFKSLGRIVYLKVELPVILERISRNPDRGLAIAPGQTVEDLYNERVELYDLYADYTVDCTTASVAECLEAIERSLSEK